MQTPQLPPPSQQPLPQGGWPVPPGYSQPPVQYNPQPSYNPAYNPAPVAPQQSYASWGNQEPHVPSAVQQTYAPYTPTPYPQNGPVAQYSAAPHQPSPELSNGYAYPPVQPQAVTPNPTSAPTPAKPEVFQPLWCVPLWWGGKPGLTWLLHVCIASG